MKVLLCSPNTHRPVRNQAGLLPPLTGICPPLGIGYLGAVLQAKGYDVALYDFMTAEESEIEAAIRKEQPDVVGVSCFTITRGAAFDVCRIAKRVSKAIHVILGGVPRLGTPPADPGVISGR